MQNIFLRRMYEAPIGVRALVIIQKLFGALAIGLSAYTLKFYCEGNSSGDEKMAAIGAGLCIICGICAILLPFIREVRVEAGMMLIWAIACGISAAGNALVANDSNDDICDANFDNCQPITSAVGWRTGVTDTALAGVQCIMFATTFVRGILAKKKV